MGNHYRLLCPVDFSAASSAALRHAAAIADHFAAQLIVLAVDDPSWAMGLEMEKASRPTHEDRENRLTGFVRECLEGAASLPGNCRYELATGDPAAEILRVSRDLTVDLIVMGSHGRTGLRKLLLGSTTERVLRETTIPVLITTAGHGPTSFQELQRHIDRIVVPVDFSPATNVQARIAFGLASAVRLPVTLLHVVEFTRRPIAGEAHIAALEAERRTLAHDRLCRMATGAPVSVDADVVVASGNPADQTARLVRETHAGLVVMGLRGLSWSGPRIGSVTYRMLCQSSTLVLALPAAMTARQEQCLTA